MDKSNYQDYEIPIERRAVRPWKAYAQIESRRERAQRAAVGRQERENTMVFWTTLLIIHGLWRWRCWAP